MFSQGPATWEYSEAAPGRRARLVERWAVPPTSSRDTLVEKPTGEVLGSLPNVPSGRSAPAERCFTDDVARHGQAQHDRSSTGVRLRTCGCSYRVLYNYVSAVRAVCANGRRAWPWRSLHVLERRVRRGVVPRSGRVDSIAATMYHPISRMLLGTTCPRRSRPQFAAHHWSRCVEGQEVDDVEDTEQAGDADAALDGAVASREPRSTAVAGGAVIEEARTRGSDGLRQ